MRTLILKILVIVLPIGLLVVLSNYFIDPANLFSSREYVSGIAAILSKGHNVDNISNYDERLLQEQMIVNLKKTPDIIVFGSSRIMEIGSDFFPGKNVLNVGVSHANIHDLVALTGLLDTMGHLPRELYINVDPGLIGEKSTLEWQSLSPYHTYFLEKSGNAFQNYETGQSNKLRKFLSLISFDYFKESMAFLIKGSKKKYYDVGKSRPLIYGRFSDGTVCYSYNYMYPDTARVANIARSTAIKEGLAVPDPAKIKLLNALLDYLHLKNVKVSFIMLPYHEDYYTNINARQENLFQTYDSIFREMAKQRGIAVIGGYDAIGFDIGRSQFYDMYHCSKEAIKKIVLN